MNKDLQKTIETFKEVLPSHLIEEFELNDFTGDEEEIEDFLELLEEVTEELDPKEYLNIMNKCSDSLILTSENKIEEAKEVLGNNRKLFKVVIDFCTELYGLSFLLNDRAKDLQEKYATKWWSLVFSKVSGYDSYASNEEELAREEYHGPELIND